MTDYTTTLRDAASALKDNPGRTAGLCRLVLVDEPKHPEARLLLSEALRRSGELDDALTLARAEAEDRPKSFRAHRQLGLILAEMGASAAATESLRRAAELKAAHPSIWRELGDQLALCGDAAGAEGAYLRHATIPGGYPELTPAVEAMRARRDAEADAMLRAHLARCPADVVALRLLADVQMRQRDVGEAEASLRRCLELAPGFALARHALAQLLLDLARPEEAREQALRMLQDTPGDQNAIRLLGNILNVLGDYEEARQLLERALTADPRQPVTWMGYGHTLRTMGRPGEAVEAYRKSIALAPRLGESYWALANLKTFRFSDADIAQMQAQLQRSDLTPGNRATLLYALGRALEDCGETANAFARYAEGAGVQRRAVTYDAEAVAAFTERSIGIFTPRFFAQRAGQGCPAPDPIFIVGLPRAGSTLIEQILASHSQVEGTSELRELGAIAQNLAPGSTYLDVVPTLDADALKATGEHYLARTRVHRKLSRPFFISKMPNDFQHTGLIQLILPNAKIIDARRHPLACGWSCFKQYFAAGQTFSYDLGEIGRYYADYVRLMAHYDDVMPGRVHRVIHEALVMDPQPHIRALLEYCGLPFEDACLHPHETRRAVRSASSEQVRRPISAEALEEWRAFEQWLGPLKDALGPVLEAYPRAPR